MAKRLTRKFSDVVEELKIQLMTEFGITQEKLDSYRNRVLFNMNQKGHKFPKGGQLLPIDLLYIDYTVQRDVVVKHIIHIMKRFDPRVMSPANACTTHEDYINEKSKIYVFDGQHRTIAAALLGFTEIPITVVVTDDITFPSYAFEECNTSTKRLGPGDLHRNRLTRYELGNREQTSVNARNLQNQFDKAKVDLQDKASRNSVSRRGKEDYFFSHFKYAYKPMEIDPTGNTLYNILDAIVTAYPNDEDVNQDIFIGLYELNRLDQLNELPSGWMKEVLIKVSKVFPKSTGINGSMFKEKARMQLDHVSPGRGWDAPNIMSNFIREVYQYAGGTLLLPYHGEGAKLQLETNPAPGLFPKKELKNA